MKKFILLSFSILLTLLVSAQINLDKFKINPTFLKFLPANTDPANLRPSDIPSEQVLKQMGLSDAEISEALDFKNSTGINSKVKNINSDSDISLQDLNLVLQDKASLIDTTIFPKQRIFGQDIFRYNNINFFNKALDAKAPENYKVGPGDEISISVWGYSEFSEALLVDKRGYITLSSYGRIYVKGLTFKKMRSLLKSKFSSFLDMKNSEIDVTLSYSRVITVNIVGEVYYPGSYSIPAINTAFNALIAARGPNQLGTVRNIYLKRDGETVDSLDVYQFLFNPTRSQDIYMQDGDYLFVPPAGEIVKVNGAINRPYTYEAKKGESIADLIKYAGGYNANAFTDVVTLKRIDYNTIKVNDVHKDHLKSTNLKNGDQVIVKSISNKLSNVVSIEGSIGVVGDYEFKKGEHLLDLLKRAKCIDKKTFLDQVYVIRLNEDRTKSHIAINLESVLENTSHKDNILLKEYDVVRVLSVDDFDDNYSVSIYGSVRLGGSFAFGNGMTLQDVILQAGGLKLSAEGSRIEVSRIIDYNIATNKLDPRRAVVKVVKIDKDLILSAEAKDFIIHPLDQIFVRANPDFKPRKNVKIIGEVTYPGSYTILRENENVVSFISRSGGLTSFAHIDGASLFRKVKYEFPEINDKLMIPDGILLDSIISTPGINNLYNLEILKEIEKKESFPIDTIIYEPVYFNFQKALANPKSRHNLVLQEGDSLYIPLKLDVVTVTGSLNNIEGHSISAPFLGKRANYYVRNFAGGYPNNKDKLNTIVLHANGAVRKSLNLWVCSISPKVKPGSTIRIISKPQIKLRKKEETIDYNRHIENVITKITAVMSLYLLIDRVNGGF
jgi:protein involved in polysaccharide export with SLBB domain